MTLEHQLLETVTLLRSSDLYLATGCEGANAEGVDDSALSTSPTALTPRGSKETTRSTGTLHTGRRATAPSRPESHICN
ncbi:MAG TPA: hypothetical protein VMV96_06485 [Acidimicrobiales bacterium]|nr:hypothetical protein [Acidimicrobiales bacterium]